MCSTYESHTASSISGIVNVYFTAQFLRANKTLMVWFPIVKTLFQELAKYADFTELWNHWLLHLNRLFYELNPMTFICIVRGFRHYSVYVTDVSERFFWSAINIIRRSIYLKIYVHIVRFLTIIQTLWELIRSQI